MELIRPFTKITKQDVRIAGGKGASLGEMTQAGIPVPPGFVILSTAFDTFIAEAGLSAEMDSILHTVNHEEMHTVEYASEKIQSLILKSDMPQEIAAAITKEFRKLNTKYVAVRSSATAEDSASAAWAGQLESYLNTTEEKLLDHVQKCWASLFTPRAIFYRFEKNLHKEKISVAVVVQTMIDSESSGIAFSVHPVTQDYNQLIIEAGFGLGEAIVSGQITPDSYVVEKKPLRILEKKVHEQVKGLFRADKGGNIWKSLGANGKEQVLTESEILTLSKLIIKIEEHYGFPVDIEWAREKGKFYITQSRPITTLTDKIQNTRFDPTKTKWYKVMERKNLFFVGLAFADIESKYFGKLLGYDLKHYLFKYEKGIWSTYRSHKEYDSLYIYFSGLIKSGDKRFLEFAKKGIEANKYAEKYINLHSKKKTEATSKNFNKEYQIYCDTLLYGVTIPWVVIGTFETMTETDRKKYQNILHMYEPFRAVSLYPSFEKEVFQKYYNMLSKKYNIESKLLHVLTPWELKKAIDGRMVPDKDILQKRYSYCVHWYNPDTQEVDFVYDPSIESRLPILQKMKVENAGSIKGTIAYKGQVKGKVKVIYETSDCIDFLEGEILVSPSTNPTLMPAILKCAGIVTDEGGMTSHAAIIARELKKPCVIGTKYATQLLKDGDEVEVDANNGVVRILEKQEKSKVTDKDSGHQNRTHFVKEVTRDLALSVVEGLDVSFVNLYKKLKGKEPDSTFMVFYIKDFLVEEWIDHRLLEELTELIYIKNLEDSSFLKNSLINYENHLSKYRDSNITSLEELQRYLESLYSVFESFLIFYLAASNDKTPKDILEPAQKVRDADKLGDTADKIVRTALKNIFSYTENYETVISSADLTNMPTVDVLRERAKNFFFIPGKFSEIISLQDFSTKHPEYYFPTEELPTNTQTLSGQIGNKGYAKGKVRIVNRKKDINTIQDGDILVSTMTTPDFVPAMQRAAAFVTDEGGITCHAAIIAREMNKPCVIGTKIATQLLKDGDLVEVDANNGVVRILEKQEKSKLQKSTADETLIKYIKSQRWGAFKNVRRPLLIASLWNLSALENKKLLAKEDIDIKKFNENSLRAFNLNQPHLPKEILIKELKDPKNVVNYIQEDYSNLAKIVSLIKTISSCMKRKDYSGLHKHTLEFIALYKKIFFMKYYLNGLLQELNENTTKYKFPKKVIDLSNKWRNDWSSIEELYFIKFIAEFLMKRKISGKDFMDYVHIDEFMALLNQKMTGESLMTLLEKRKNKGYILLNLKKKSYQNKILDFEEATLPPIEKIISDYYHQSMKHKLKDNSIYGKSVIKHNQLIIGECILINEKKDLLKHKLDGKVLVTTMTTPNFIPYIRKVKGIITDDGGVICHAAINSREYNIPCIIGTEIATKVLKDGDLVKIDTNKGIVKILKRS